MDTTDPKTEEEVCTTEEFAALNMVKPETVHKRRCLTGSYFGAVANKLANGRLEWPRIAVYR